MEHSRRFVLGTVALVASAGCLGTGDPGDSEETTTTTPSTGTPETETATTTDLAPLTVSEVTVTPAVVARDSPDTIDVSGDADEQFVIVELSADGTPAPGTADLALETDGRTFDVRSGVGGMAGELWDFGEPYGGSSSGWVAFVLPNPHETTSATLSWPGGSFELSAAARSALGRPPTSFQVREFSVPETIRIDEDATLAVTVENTSEVDGTWVGAVNRSGPSVAYIPETSISLDVPAGETATWEYTNTPDDRIGSETGTMSFEVRWRGDSLSRSVEVIEND